MGSRIPDDDPRVSRFFREMAKGKRMVEACAASGLHRGTGLRLLREEGIDSKVEPRQFISEDAGHRVEELVSHGGKAVFAAEATGFDKSTITRLMQRRGTPVRELKRQWWERAERAVAWLVAKGRTERDACKRCGVPYMAFMKRKSRRLEAPDGRLTDA